MPGPAVSLREGAGVECPELVIRGCPEDRPVIDFDRDAQSRTWSSVGREAERTRLDQFVSRVRDGMSEALVVVGEAGIGKTSLLATVRSPAEDVRCVWVTGAPSEQFLAYAGLHRLLLPFLSGIDQLPQPQQEALRLAFGLQSGAVPDPFLVSVGTLGLLAEFAVVSPLICIIDDAQWLDRESLTAVAFVGRRLQAEGIGLLLGVRTDDNVDLPVELGGLGVMALTGLDEPAAARLLKEHSSDAMHPQVVRRLFAGTRGNPLALITVAEALTRDQQVGRAELPEPLPVGRHLEQHFLRRIRSLPERTRLLLLVAAAAPPGDVALTWRACAALNLLPDDADPAVAAGVLNIVGTVTFRHPLIRSAVYSAASGAERRRIHVALGETTDPADPDRRAWHLAAAAVAPTEAVALELERSAERAGVRGGYTVQAAFLRRAAELSGSRSLRVERLLGAAEASFVAGDRDAALSLVDELGDDLPTSLHNRRERVRTSLSVTRTRPSELPGVILARLAAPGRHDVRSDRDALLEAMSAVLIAGRYTPPGTGLLVAEAVRRAVSDPTEALTFPDRLMHAHAARIIDGHQVSTGLFRTLLAGEVPPLEANPVTVIPLVTTACEDMLDLVRLRGLFDGMEGRLRAQGAIPALSMVMYALAGIDTRAGRFEQAAMRYTEATDITASMGNPTSTAQQMLLLAWQGREAQTRAVADAAFATFGEPVGVGMVVAIVDYGMAMLELGRGHYAQALAHTQHLFTEDLPGIGTTMLPIMVEAAVRCGDRGAAGAALDRLASRAVAAGSPYALGGLARSTALTMTGDDECAEGNFRRALEYYEITDLATDLAWTHLVYGEWLRRLRRRADARVQLRSAYEAFLAMGATVFAQRARAELMAAGERLVEPRGSGGARLSLSPQETRIAVLAAQGSTNQEIATHLFITASTVEYHLTKVFRRHHLTSRRELRQLLQQHNLSTDPIDRDTAPKAER